MPTPRGPQALVALLLVASPAASQCPTEHFPPQSPHPDNAAYPDPVLDVRCTATNLVVESNGIPSYPFVQITPHDLVAQDHVWRIPLEPEVRMEPEPVPLLGAIAIATNGSPIFGPNEGPMPDPYGDPVYNGIMDTCQGHTARGGVYHYHALLVSCLTAADPPGEPSPIIGYAFDGYPIYGPWGCVDEDCTEVIEFQSSWVQIGDPTTYAWDAHEYQPRAEQQYLDECNGRIGPDGTYRYHATATFPYILGCYGAPGVTSVPPPPPVPDGTGTGQPMRPYRRDLAGTHVQVDWDDTCTPTQVNLLHGPLQDLPTYRTTGSICAIANPEQWMGVPDGDLWFVLVSTEDDGREASWGRSSFGERQPDSPSGYCGTMERDLTGECP
ncbi:MAG: YHYH protein [Acidobacteriota bacterium]